MEKKEQGRIGQKIRRMAARQELIASCKTRRDENGNRDRKWCFFDDYSNRFPSLGAGFKDKDAMKGLSASRWNNKTTDELNISEIIDWIYLSQGSIRSYIYSVERGLSDQSSDCLLNCEISQEAKFFSNSIGELLDELDIRLRDLPLYTERMTNDEAPSINIEGVDLQWL